MDKRHFCFCGYIERPGRRGFRWVRGFGEVVSGGVCEPWSTVQEIRSQAKRDGFRAVFHPSEHSARVAAGFRVWA